MSEQDGGPAFPQPDASDNCGMSLRDWFAGQALAGILGSPETDRDATFDMIAQDAYDHADAMLEARAILTNANPEPTGGPV